MESLKAGETKNFEKSYFDVGFLLVEPFALTITLNSMTQSRPSDHNDSPNLFIESITFSHSWVYSPYVIQ